jgi:hypothetical protein
MLLLQHDWSLKKDRFHPSSPHPPEYVVMKKRKESRVRCSSLFSQYRPVKEVRNRAKSKSKGTRREVIKKKMRKKRAHYAQGGTKVSQIPKPKEGRKRHRCVKMPRSKGKKKCVKEMSTSFRPVVCVYLYVVSIPSIHQYFANRGGYHQVVTRKKVSLFSLSKESRLIQVLSSYSRSCSLDPGF